MKKFGLIGKNISYSFSRSYFAEKFEKEGLIDCEYVNFDLPSLADFRSVLEENPSLVGLNVTIPYKEEIIPFLDELDETAREIGAVNVIKITEEKKLIGCNTDFYGFSESLKPMLETWHTKALILGTGGASKAVAYALKKLGISFRFVSRKPTLGQYSYNDLTSEVLKKYKIIINCTPLGTFPNVSTCVSIPYEFLTSEHLLYDLIYNPEKTLFLQKGEKKGAKICNGLKMLQLQAEKAYQIWSRS